METTILKNDEILSCYETLKVVGGKVLPRKLSYAIARNLSWMEREVKLYQSQLQEILGRYAKTDENGEFILGGKDKNMYTFDTIEQASAFRDEMSDLSETEVECRVFKTSAEVLENCYEENSRYDMLTAAEEAALSWMLDYGDDA